MRISQAKQYLASVVSYNLEQFERGGSNNTYIVPFFVGDPGVGKTAVPRQVAREAQIPYYQSIVAQFDPGELAGLPFMGESEIEVERMVDGNLVSVKETRTKMIRLRPSYLPDPETSEGKIGIFNLDELPQAMLAGQNVMSQLVNEWRIGEHRISPGITICCTGNKPENKAGTTSMPTHLRDRLTFIEIETNLDDTLSYFAEVGVDPRIRAFLKQNSQFLHQFVTGANAYPTPRSWEKTSAILSMDLPKDIRTEALGGQIGAGAATTFESWLRVEDKLPKMEDLINSPEDPDKSPVFGNNDADVAYLIMMALADKTTRDNVGNIIKYVRRLPNQEFAAVWYQDVLRRDNSISQTKAVTDWKLKDGVKLMI